MKNLKSVLKVFGKVLTNKTDGHGETFYIHVLQHLIIDIVEYNWKNIVWMLVF